MRYFELSGVDRMALSNDCLADAIRLEAIHRGVAPPISVPEQLAKGAIQGYSTPAESITLHEIVRPSQYSGSDHTGLAFRTAEDAAKAMEGAISLHRSYNSVPVICTGEWAIQAVRLGTPGMTKQVNVKEYEWDEAAFDAVRDACLEDLQQLRQAQYDIELKKTKKAEYLRLANNDESIARAFWMKAERTDWDDAPAQVGA